jgi:transcription antitermination protein NusB
MGKRTTGRKLAMQLVYQADLRQAEEIEEIITDFFEVNDYIEETQEWATVLAQGAWNYRAKAYDKIESKSKEWALDRINKVDKSIIIVAMFEIDVIKTPVAIVINEAVEMAKKYSSDDSPKFINGILG